MDLKHFHLRERKRERERESSYDREAIFVGEEALGYH